ncbi:MAG: HAMP domain-containing sensor histidine kinase [Eubacteriales bacterium]|nr:HAMP domain-containing sensor histidine kinase [Eubacteriales bacterium]
MKHSIRRQFAAIFIGLMAGTILLCWFINGTFLEKYYIANKKAVLLKVYTELENAVNSEDLDSETYNLSLQQNCGKYNLSLLVLDSSARIVKSSESDSNLMKLQLLQHVFMETDPTDEIMEKTDDYIVQRVNDPRSDMEYIEIWGILGNSYFFIIRTALEGIQDSVAIANRFLAYVGILSAIASGMIIWYVSRKITTPILQLADISRRMAHLDFDAEYQGQSHNEIDLLGENINKLSETLEKTISELKTANNELKKDIEKKNEIDEMRKEFLSNVSHELKTPIALIQGYAEGLQEGISDDPESRSFYCEVIVDEAAKMNEMMKKLLTLNQLEFGNDVVSMERFDITALIDNYLQSADLLARQNEITVQMEQKEPVFVWGDEFKIEEVFMNYFSNAINHCTGDKVIEVSIVQRDNCARVSVFNTGEPIPEESLPHLWDKFYKVDKARTREYGGSGVGLSIVKAIMKSMNQNYGVINYENGVAFWFELELFEKK